MPKKLQASLHDSAARSATGNGTLELDIASYDVGSFFLDVTAASGTTPTLDVTVQTYDAISGKWFTLVTFTQATAATTERKVHKLSDGPMGARLRARYVIGGTGPSFTFSVGAAVETVGPIAGA